MKLSTVLASFIRRAPPSGNRILALALGSNVGDRVANIDRALQYLERESDVKVVDTSFLYETHPLYVQDQPRFINGACLISTSLDPQSLLDLLKDVETKIGRTPSFRNGPRVVDLDLLFDEDRVYNLAEIPGRELNIPHPRIQEREFVLRPLADIIPHFIHPVLRTPVRTLLSRIKPDPSMRRIISFPTSPPNTSQDTTSETSTVWSLGDKTYLMATLNSTPDSFSDGGDHFSIENATQYAQGASEYGAAILDIGGYSTRPGSSYISPEEEISRTVPYISNIRNIGIKIPISVDTFRASVASACLQAGANCINDVYALTGAHQGVGGISEHDTVDDHGVPVSDGGEMLKLAAQASVPLILMHSRGPANQNKGYTLYPGGVLEGVRTELGLRVARALQAGVRRWNIVIDPGFGFSKSVEDNVVLLGRHAELVKPSKLPQVTRLLPRSPRTVLDNCPTLIGISRKTFLGQLVGRPEAAAIPKEREWATAAAVTAAVQQGSDIVRVHSVREMRDVVRVADAVWRSKTMSNGNR